MTAMKNKEQIKCEACSILIGEGLEEQELTQVSVRQATSSGSRLTITQATVALRVCSACRESIRRREKRTGVAYLTPPGLYGG